MALVEAKVEGTIDDITLDTATGGAIITVMTAGASRVTVYYTPGDMLTVPPPVPPARVRQKSIRTPSQRLTVAQLISNSSLPGRPTFEGFEGGTIVAEGFYRTDPIANPNPALVVNVFLANHISVEPAETVLIGAVTANNGTTIAVNTVNITPLTDSRYSTNPGNPATPVYLNDSGFAITVASLTPAPATPNPPPPAGPLGGTAVQGYFASGQMHAYSIEYGARGLLAPLANPALPIDHPRISIERAQIRDLGTTFDVEIRGHITAPPPMTQTDHLIEVRVRDMIPGTFGTTAANFVYRGGSPAAADITRALTVRIDQRGTGGGPIQLDPPVQRFRFRGTISKTGVHDLVPERIEVRNVTAEAALLAAFPARPAALNEVREEADTDVRDA